MTHKIEDRDIKGDISAEEILIPFEVNYAKDFNGISDIVDRWWYTLT